MKNVIDIQISGPASSGMTTIMHLIQDCLSQEYELNCMMTEDSLTVREGQFYSPEDLSDRVARLRKNGLCINLTDKQAPRSSVE